MAVTAECPACGKKHRLDDKWEERVEACKARAEKREAREKAKLEDLERRQAHAKAFPLERFLVEFVIDGTKRERGELIPRSLGLAVSQVKKTYPAPKDWAHKCDGCLLDDRENWDLVSVFHVDSLRLNWGQAA